MSDIYETQEIIVSDPIPDKIYTTNPSSNKIENFIELLNPTTTFQIIRSFDISSHLNLLLSPLDFLFQTFMEIMEFLPLKLSRMIVTSNNKRLPLVVLVLTIKMGLQSAQFRLLLDGQGHYFCMLQCISLQLLISSYGHLLYNMPFIFGIFFQINTLNYHLWN